MSKLALPILALLLVAGPAHAGRDVLRQQSSRQIDPAGIRGVRIENRHGDVRITESPDGRIHVTALKVVHSGSRAESQKMAADLHVDIGTEGGALVVRARYPDRRSIRVGFWDLFHDFEVPSAEVKLGLEVPEGLAITTRTSSGDVTCDGVRGALQIETTSGDVDVAAVPGALGITTSSGDVDAREIGALRLRTRSGDAELTTVRGPVDAHTTSGNLTVHGAGDSLTLGTVSGDVEVERSAGRLAVATTSGEVKVTQSSGAIEIEASSGGVELGVRSPLAGARVATGSGDIELRFERGMGARLDLQTSNGQLEMGSPIVVQSLTRHRVLGQLRQGGASVSLRTASGDIHVLTGEQGS